jgi:hypothetical protein
LPWTDDYFEIQVDDGDAPRTIRFRKITPIELEENMKRMEGTYEELTGACFEPELHYSKQELPKIMDGLTALQTDQRAGHAAIATLIRNTK